MSWLATAAFSVGAATGMPATNVEDVLAPPPPGAVRLGGALGEALDLCITNRILAQDVGHLIAPFRERKDTWEWRGEFWGKWITSAEWALRYTNDPALRAKVEGAVRDLLATQSPDGYLGAHPDGARLKNWDIWSRKYTMLGLLGWHELSGDIAALDAAKREADLLLQETGPGAASPLKDMWNGLAASSVMEPLILLSRRTGDPRYLDHVSRIIALWPTPEGPDLLNKALRGVPVFEMFPKPKPVAEMKEYGDGGKSKAYEMMSCFEGLCELHRTTGRADGFDAARKAFAGIRDREITIIGSGSDWERWCDGRGRQTERWHLGMETCVTVTWIKFANQLLRLTGDPAYVDDIERAAWNGLLGAQGRDGTWWCHHAPLAGTRERAPEHCGLHQNCCVASGPRGLALLPQIALMSHAEGPVINLHGPQRGTFPLPAGGEVRLEESGNYPVEGALRIAVTPREPSTFALRLHIPAWSHDTRLAITGERQPRPAAGTYAVLKRAWKAGDIVELVLDVSTRVERAPGHPEFIAFTHGPLVLARDRREAGAEVDAPIRAPDGTLKERCTALPGALLACEVPQPGGVPLLLRDFASAGSTWDDASRYRVWMNTSGK